MELFNLARHGVISAADADGLGIGPSRRRVLVRQGVIRRLIRGWYAVPDADGSLPWLAGEPWERATAIHRLTTVALLRSFGGRVAASHYSAQVLHELPTWRADLSTVHLTRLDDDHSRHRRGAVIHPRSTGLTVLTADGLATVPIAEAIVGTGLLGATARDPSIMAMEALIAADSALHRGLVPDTDFTAELARVAGHPGVRSTRAALLHRDGRHESVGETRLAHVVRGLGLASTPQVEVVIGGRSRMIDRLLDDHPVALEFDGFVKYQGGGAAASLAVHAEKVRESEIRDAIDAEFVRVTWSGLAQPELLSHQMAEAARRVRRRRAA